MFYCLPDLLLDKEGACIFSFIQCVCVGDQEKPL